jgi:hypothetical protein
MSGNCPEYDTDKWTRIGFFDLVRSEHGTFKAVGIVLDDDGWTELEGMGATPSRAVRALRREVEKR